MLVEVLLIITTALEATNGQFNAIGSISNCPRMNARFGNCDPTKRYSNLDGSCNNLAAPWVGKAATPYKRYFPAAYDDGFNAARLRGSSGTPLPNPRVISRVISTQENGQLEPFYTHLMPLFGQFLAHDITFSQISSDANGGSLSCSCGSGSSNCLSFVMPTNDNIMRQSCMKFTRTQNSNGAFDCGLTTREQLNSLSAFIDGTQIYGVDANRNTFLRVRQQGQLRTSQGLTPSKPLPPLSTTETCQSQPCFLAGESRTSNNLGLVGIHTLFIREHNRIATELARVNPTWNDESLFQETRKIVIGILQNIVYNEWLPAVVGASYAKDAGITSNQGDTYHRGYDPNTNPSIANEFAAAAFRFGHTLVRQQFSRFSTSGTIAAPPLNVSQIIFNSAEAFNSRAGGLDAIFIGLLNDASAKFDPNIANTLQNHLFEVKNADGTTEGVDLFATNINRGRDHGVPPYNSIRERCGLSKAPDFDSLADVMSKANIDKLKAIYSNVNDVDFYVGGLMENQLPGAVVGPSFACIIVNQFRDLKNGDRFFFENGPGPTAFTLEQLREIKKMTMSRLICNDFEAISIQPKAFVLQNVVGNEKVSCSTLPRIDITKWRI